MTNQNGMIAGLIYDMLRLIYRGNSSSVDLTDGRPNQELERQADEGGK
ncbi:MAG: hypothetical protein M0Z89_12040 [Nitrospiraceae bacterium]|nr:hypothetical protein [Nitrospiraceae bacterium]